MFYKRNNAVKKKLMVGYVVALHDASVDNIASVRNKPNYNGLEKSAEKRNLMNISGFSYSFPIVPKNK